MSSVVQMPDTGAFLVLSTSGGDPDGLGAFQTAEHMELLQIVLTMLKTGPWGGEEMIRLKVFPTAAMETPMATSGWFALADIGSPEPAHWIGVVPFTFDPPLPVNKNLTYHVAAETTDYVRSIGAWVGFSLDWPESVYESAAAGRRGAQMRLLGYHEVPADPEEI